MKKDESSGSGGLGSLLVKTSKRLKSFSGRFGTPKSSKNLKLGSRRLPENASDYDLIEVCGQGASSLVIRGKCKRTGEDVAVKCVELDSLQLDLDMFVRETAVMRSMRHDHLLPLYATSVETHYLWIITPFVSGGTLENILHHAFPNGFSERVVASISKMVLEALAYLHNHGIVHRDIKTSNILLRNDGHVYLGDLGIAAQVVQADTQNPGTMVRLERHTFAGTLQYISPEIVEGIGYDERVDVWSYGITMLECITGTRPYASMPMHQALMAIMNDDPPEPPATVSEACADFVRRCLNKDPTQRWTADQLLNHRFLRLAEGKKLLHKELVQCLPPEEVRTATFVKQAMANTKGANSPSADTLYADGLRRLRCLQPSSDTSTSSNPPTTSSGGLGSPQTTGSTLDVERTGSSWNFFASFTGGSKGRKAQPGTATKDAGGDVPPAPPLQSIPSARLMMSPGGSSRALNPGTPTGASPGGDSPMRSASGALCDQQPKTRRLEAQGKAIRWAPGVTSRNGRLAKSDSLASISSERPARSTSLS